MNWKPIPQEAPANKLRKHTHIRACHLGNRTSKDKPHPSISYRLMQKVSSKLIDFVKKERKYKLHELSDLIIDLQKTISKLQKKKMFLMEKEAKKYKNSKRNFRSK